MAEERQRGEDGRLKKGLKTGEEQNKIAQNERLDNLCLGLGFQGQTESSSA